jgi:hypothetical protein
VAPSSKGTRLFLRWAWVAYLPLLLLAVVAGLRFAGILGRNLAAALVLVLVLWTGVALRLILERRRLGVKVGIPRGFVVWLTVPLGIGTVGLLLFFVGAEGLSTDWGFGMFAAGVFLITLAVALPLFRLIDALIRGLGRVAIGLLFGRRKHPRPRSVKTRPAPSAGEDSTQKMPKVAGAGRR